MFSISFTRLAPVPVYLAILGAVETSFMSYGILASVYRIQEAGLNPLQLILVGTVLEASVFLFEIPTGIVADVYSRRLSIIIGFFLIGAGFIVEGLFPIFGVILVAQVIWGIGYTFTSGAQQAWIADEVGNRSVGRIFLRGSQFGQIGGLIGIGMGIALGSIALGLPLVFGGALSIALGIFLVIVMPERGFKATPSEERESWKAMAQTLRSGLQAVRLRPVLIVILVVTLIYGAASEPIDRLWPLHLLTNFTFPSLGTLDMVVWFGIIGATSRILSIAATEVIRRRLNIDNPRTTVWALFAVNAVPIASIAIFALTGNFALAIAMFLVSGVMRQISSPLLDTWTNQYAESRVRATIFSMRGQSDAIGQVAFGPVMGALATVTSIRITLLGVAALLIPPQVIYAFTLRRTENSEPENNDTSH